MKEFRFSLPHHDILCYYWYLKILCEFVIMGFFFYSILYMMSPESIFGRKYVDFWGMCSPASAMVLSSSILVGFMSMLRV